VREKVPKKIRAMRNWHRDTKLLIMKLGWGKVSTKIKPMKNWHQEAKNLLTPRQPYNKLEKVYLKSFHQRIAALLLTDCCSISILKVIAVSLFFLKP
jgi:hypothetical protein